MTRNQQESATSAKISNIAGSEKNRISSILHFGAANDFDCRFCHFLLCMLPPVCAHFFTLSFFDCHVGHQRWAASAAVCNTVYTVYVLCYYREFRRFKSGSCKD